VPRGNILLALPVGHGLTSIRTASSTFFQSKFALHVAYGIMKKEDVRISNKSTLPCAISTCPLLCQPVQCVNTKTPWCTTAQALCRLTLVRDRQISALRRAPFGLAQGRQDRHYVAELALQTGSDDPL